MHFMRANAIAILSVGSLKFILKFDTCNYEMPENPSCNERYSFKRRNAQQSSAAGNNLIAHRGNGFHVILNYMYY